MSRRNRLGQLAVCVCSQGTRHFAVFCSPRPVTLLKMATLGRSRCASPRKLIIGEGHKVDVHESSNFRTQGVPLCGDNIERGGGGRGRNAHHNPPRPTYHLLLQLTIYGSILQQGEFAIVPSRCTKLAVCTL